MYNWKLNLESRSSTNANAVAVAKITVEKGVEGGKKVSLRRFFWLTRRLRVCRKNAFQGILQHEQQVLPDTI